VTRVALVTALKDQNLYGDGPPLVGAFDRLGVETEVVPWGDGTAWERFDAVLVRNTWDYIYDRPAFLGWASHVEGLTPLANSFEALTWNTDKRYLGDLADAGIPTVPTLWVEPGERSPEIPWPAFVVKPAISAGARLSARYDQAEDPDLHVRRIHRAGATAMIQPYVDAVDTTGETGTYVFGGEVSHAITKGTILRTGEPARDELSASSHDQVGPTPVDPTLAAFAQRVLAVAPPVVYARVDTAPGPDGEPLLLELEVTEPFLFLEHAPPAADAFATAVMEWMT
jgi:hypothetical protein